MQSFGIIIPMNTFPCSVNTVTLAGSRTEETHLGTAEILEDGALISYECADYGAKLRVCGDALTLTRTGEDGYTLTLREGVDSQITLCGVNIPVRTHKLKFSAYEAQIKILAVYTLGGEKITLNLRANILQKQTEEI